MQNMRAAVLGIVVLAGLTAGRAGAEASSSDRVSFVSSPANVTAGVNYNIAMSFSCTQARYLRVDLLCPGGGYTWHGGNSVMVFPGSTTTTLQVGVTAETPPGDGNYLWHAYLAAKDGDWQNATANAAGANVSVSSASSASSPSSPPVSSTPAGESLRIVSASATAYVGRALSIVVDFSRTDVAQGRYVQADLLIPSRNYAWYGAVKDALPAGQRSGRLTLRLPVNNDAPPGDGYVVNVFMAADGSTWQEAAAKDSRAVAVAMPVDGQPVNAPKR